MRNTNVTEQAYNRLRSYVSRVNHGAIFNTNTIREKLSSVSGLKSSQIGAVIGTAVRRGLIERVGTTTSSNRLHNGGRVGTYVRG